MHTLYHIIISLGFAPLKPWFTRFLFGNIASLWCTVTEQGDRGNKVLVQAYLVVRALQKWLDTEIVHKRIVKVIVLLRGQQRSTVLTANSKHLIYRVSAPQVNSCHGSVAAAKVFTGTQVCNQVMWWDIPYKVLSWTALFQPFQGPSESWTSAQIGARQSGRTSAPCSDQGGLRHTSHVSSTHGSYVGHSKAVNSLAGCPIYDYHMEKRKCF